MKIVTSIIKHSLFTLSYIITFITHIAKNMLFERQIRHIHIGMTKIHVAQVRLQVLPRYYCIMIS